MPIIAV